MNAFRGAAAMARMEFRQALWSLRSLALGAVFLLFVAAGTYLGLGAVLGAPGAGLPPEQAAGVALLAVVAMTAFFAPVIAIFSTVDAVVGERATHTLDLLLTRPTTRRGLALGKLLGRAAHLALVALVAVAAGLLLIAASAGLALADALSLAVLVALLCAVWASVALLLSSLARTPTSALVAGFVVWLTFYPFWGFVQAGFDRVGLGGLPPLLNPNTLFLGAASEVLPSLAPVLTRLTEGLPQGAGLVALLAYLGTAAGLAVEVFHRQDEAVR